MDKKIENKEFREKAWEQEKERQKKLHVCEDEGEEESEVAAY